MALSVIVLRSIEKKIRVCLVDCIVCKVHQKIVSVDGVWWLVLVGG